MRVMAWTMNDISSKAETLHDSVADMQGYDRHAAACEDIQH